MTRLAGLCHDLGHGPYSHVWDKHFVPRMCAKKPHLKEWSHEKMSQQMFEYMIDQNGIEIDRDDARTVMDMIDPPKKLVEGPDCLDVENLSQKNKENLFLYEIVNNTKSSIDVDKFDYLARDCHNLGVKQSYDSSRLMNFSRVINDEICFSAKECFNLYEMFHTRYSLFKVVYLHRASQALEFMITDALEAADDFCLLSDACDSPERFTYLTDHVIRTIEASHEPELRRSREIIFDIRTRNLYKFVDEIVVDSDSPEALWLKTMTPEVFVTYQDTSDASLSPDSIILSLADLNYAMKDRNPIDHVRFYSRHDLNKSFRIDRKQVSYLIPSKFQETVVRVFSRNASAVGAATRCFRNMVGRLHLSDTESQSPSALPFTASPRPRRKRKIVQMLEKEKDR